MASHLHRPLALELRMLPTIAISWRLRRGSMSHSKPKMPTAATNDRSDSTRRPGSKATTSCTVIARPANSGQVRRTLEEILSRLVVSRSSRDSPIATKGWSKEERVQRASSLTARRSARRSHHPWQEDLKAYLICPTTLHSQLQWLLHNHPTSAHCLYLRCSSTTETSCSTTQTRSLGSATPLRIIHSSLAHSSHSRFWNPLAQTATYRPLRASRRLRSRIQRLVSHSCNSSKLTARISTTMVLCLFQLVRPKLLIYSKLTKARLTIWLYTTFTNNGKAIMVLSRHSLR